MDLKVILDTSEIEQLAKDMEEIQPRLKQAGAALAAQTHAHVVEKAQRELHARRSMFLENLKFAQVDDGVWVVTVLEPALWIEDGKPPGSMVQDLLQGRSMRVIPFDQGKTPQNQTPALQSLTATIKAELKKRNIPYKKIETNADGSPKVGKLHSFSINDQPLKPKGAPFGWGNMHGYGRGLPGQVMQGPTGIPFLRGVSIYQKAMLNKDGTTKTKPDGAPMVNRSILTFRTVVPRHEQEGRWYFPGKPGLHSLEDAERWAEQEWEKISMEILNTL